MSLDTSLLGQPVELGQIGRELKNLWESAGGTKSRASLVNFAVYCEGAEALEANTRLISEFTRNHACRAILLANVAASEERPQPQAWINAHCHLGRAGAKQVCCEQITFLLPNPSHRLLANVLFGNLDSDLPLYFWWQGELPDDCGSGIWTWVDRLIFDSREWRDFGSQLGVLCKALDSAGTRMIPCDLNWTRTLHLRQAVAQMFDHPENLAQIPNLNRLTISHAEGHASTALLFAAWIAAQLRWEFQSRSGAALRFRGPAGQEIACELQTAAGGAPISCCELSAGSPFVAIQRDAGSCHHKAEVRTPDGRIYHHLLPAGADDIAGLLDEELMSGGKHRVYLKTIAAAAPLFR